MYQLYRGGTTPVGAPVQGTGAQISFGPQAIEGTYTVVATKGTCNLMMNGNAIVTKVNAEPPHITSDISDFIGCAWQNATISIATDGANLSYQWQFRWGANGGILDIGANDAGYTGVLSNSLTIKNVYTDMNTWYRCIMKNNYECTDTSYLAAINSLNTPYYYSTVTGGGNVCQADTESL